MPDKHFNIRNVFYLHLNVYFVLFEAGFPSVAQAGLEVTIPIVQVGPKLQSILLLLVSQGLRQVSVTRSSYLVFWDFFLNMYLFFMCTYLCLCKDNLQESDLHF